MCGIVGLYNNKISKEELHKKISFANESQLHRGPDGSGVYLSDSLSFTMGMTRLAILDFKNGNQPFFSRDRKYCLTFNGEIINSKELRKELEAKKYQFKSDNSDTEVLLYLLIQEREKCLSKINGMFSFCFFDIENKKILISRDRFGIKPLYYFYKNNVLGFASELKTLKVLFDEPIDINKESLSDFLSLMYIPSPKTIYKNIYKLCPGELIKFDLINSQFIKIKWSEHKFQPDKKLDEKSSQEGLKFYVDEAIKKWTLSDVPVSNSLSGGLDSSIISSVLGKNKFKLHNFTLGFSSKEDTKFDEIDLAKLVSKKFDQKHTLIQLNHENLLNDLDRILEDIHEPYGGGLPSWFVYKSVSKKYKVCFNGTGIDEFFGSYGKWNKLDGIFIKKVSYERFKKYFFDSRYYASETEKSKILNFNINKLLPTQELFYEKFKTYDGSVIDKFALLDINTQLSDEFLNITDNFSMSHSLEVRPPYLDLNLTDFMFKIPYKIRVGDNKNLKKLFKNSFKRLLPDEIYNSKKRGFILPVENWLKNKLASNINFYFSKKKLSEHGLFQNDIYESIYLPFLNRSKIISRFDIFHRSQTLIWGLLFFQLWFDKHMNKNKIKI